LKACTAREAVWRDHDCFSLAWEGYKMTMATPQATKALTVRASKKMAVPLAVQKEGRTFPEVIRAGVPTGRGGKKMVAPMAAQKVVEAFLAVVDVGPTIMNICLKRTPVATQRVVKASLAAVDAGLPLIKTCR
jgi:hypothetical protein